jgi:hypothetical protein
MLSAFDRSRRFAMHMRSLSKLLSILFVLDAMSTAQTTWYVDVTATPPGDGTQASPYTSIQHAITSATTHNGDTILVAPGTYVGNVTITIPGVYLRSTSGPAATTILGRLNADGLNAGNGPAWVEGFTIQGTDPNVANSAYLARATMRYCILRSPPTSPPFDVGVSYDDQTVIERCVVSHFHKAFEMFSFATVAAEIRETIVTEVDIVLQPKSIAHFNYCCLPSIPTGVQITTDHTQVGDPGFKDPANSDYHLLANSICIDTGNPTGSHDPDGSVADIGALPADPRDLHADLVYCASEINGDGCYGLVQSSGVCSATSGLPYVLSAHGLPPNKLGRLLYSAAPAAIPFQGGTLCLANPLHRTDPTHSTSNGLPPPLDQCSGVLSFDFNARIQSGIDSELVIGRHVYAQFRYRDPHDPLGFGVGWTNAIRFVIQP